MFERSMFWRILAGLTGLSVMLTVDLSNAADVKYPSKPITIVVTMPAGGPNDVMARVLAAHSKKYFGVPLVVLNVPGSGGIIGCKQVMNTVPDGHILLLTNGGIMTNYRLGIADFNYDAFQPICRMAVGNECLATYAGAEWKDVKGIFEYARKNAGRLRYAATSGSTSHLVMAAIEQAVQAKFLFVPYQGEAKRTAALAGQHVDVISLQAQSAIEYVKAGKFVMLGLLKDKRGKIYPEIPTLAEQGVPVTETWEDRCLFAPKGTPKDRIAFLAATVKKMIEDAEFVNALYKTGQEPAYLNAQDFAKFLKEQDDIIDKSAKSVVLQK